MDADVDVVHTRRLGQIFLEVFHMSNEQFLLAGKVFVDFPVFIEHMNYYYFLLAGQMPRFLETVMNPSLPNS